MRRLNWLFTAAPLALFGIGSSWSLTVQLDAYDVHNWGAVQNIEVVGFDGTHTTSGPTALRLRYHTASGEGIVSTDEFLSEAIPGLAGYTAQIFTVGVGGATGSPEVRFELIGEDTTPMPASDATLSTDGWTPILIGPPTITQTSRQLRLVFNPGTASGEFDLWVDDIRRDAEYWDHFTATDTVVIPGGIDGTARGESTTGGTTLATPGPSPFEGTGMYGLTWSGDSDGTVEVRHLYTTPLTIFPGQSPLFVTAHVPSGTSLPSVTLTLEDGANTLVAPSSAIASNDSWEQLNFDISNIGPHPLDENAITEVRFTFTGAGASGTLFLDSANLAPVELSVFESE